MSSRAQNSLFCSYCQHILIEPKFLACGHRYCSSCLKKIITSDQEAVCAAEKCGQTITSNAIYADLGTENDLKNLTDIMCANRSDGCTWQGDYTSYKDHLQVCTYQRLECELCTIAFASRILYEQHSQMCPKAFISCPLKKFGCDSQVRREALREHATLSSVEHLQILADICSSFRSQCLINCSPPSYLANNPASTSDHIDVKTLQNELFKQNQLIEQLRQEQKSFHSILIKRERDLTRISVDLQLSKGELCQLKKELELSKSMMHSDGTYLWRIDNIQQLFRNAKNASQPIHINSPSFYTSRYGYKISLKLYLNGDKSVRNTHLSLYITVMRTENDSILEWPFKYPVTLCLYDRSSTHDHVVHTIKPDVQSECFHQPKMESNKSGGIPEFCPLWKVFSKDFGYVQNDTMFIKALVDFNLYPTRVWPYWTKLQSSGLPNNVEHIKLKEILCNTK